MGPSYSRDMAASQPVSAADGRDDGPFVRQVVLDCPHPRTLADFYCELLGHGYRPGDVPPPAGQPDPVGHPSCIFVA
jgi:hypothetical protein